MKDWSQNGEGSLVLQAVRGREPASFIDIGAFTGLELSNTWSLLELGWKGTYYEADPFAFCKLYENTRPHADRAKLVLGVVGDSNGMTAFHVSPSSGVSTTSEAHVERWKTYPGCDFRSILSPKISYSEVAAMMMPDTEVVSIDVESESVNVLVGIAPHLKSLPNLRVLVVEHDTMFGVVSGVANGLGLTLASCNNENLIYIRP